MVLSIKIWLKLSSKATGHFCYSGPFFWRETVPFFMRLISKSQNTIITIKESNPEVLLQLLETKPSKFFVQTTLANSELS